MAILRATEETGVYEIEGLGTRIRLIEWRAGSFYDSVAFAGAATVASPVTISSGSQQFLFINLQNKFRHHTNLDNNAGRLPALNELICNRIGAHVVQAIGNLVPVDADIIKVAHGGQLRVTVNTTRLIFDQPLYTAQSGYGVSGSTTRNNTGVVTTGVPSAAAAPQLLVAQPIGPNDGIGGDITFNPNTWLDNATGFTGATTVMPTVSSPMVVTVFLDGLIKKPQGA
jgi:hypothetical protein